MHTHAYRKGACGAVWLATSQRHDGPRDSRSSSSSSCSSSGGGGGGGGGGSSSHTNPPHPHHPLFKQFTLDLSQVKAC